MVYGYRPDDISDLTENLMAVVIFLPKFLDEVIAPLRERFDPDYAMVRSHITLVAPFCSQQPLPKVADSVASLISKNQMVEVKLSSILDCYPDSPQICWGVEGLEKLSRELYTALDLPLPFKKFRPHVTIAAEISPHRVLIVKEQIVPYLPDEKIIAETVDLVAPVADSNWVSVRTFSLREPA